MRGKLLAAAFWVIAVTVGFASSAVAQDWGPCEVHVTVIEPKAAGAISTSSVANASIYFRVDGPVGAICAGSGSTQCAAGAWLIWAPPYYSSGSGQEVQEALRQIATTKAILATLQMGVATGLKVRLYGFNLAGGYCQVGWVNSLNS